MLVVAWNLLVPINQLSSIIYGQLLSDEIFVGTYALLFTINCCLVGNTS